MASIPELLDGHVTLEVECLDRLYLNGYIGWLATGMLLRQSGLLILAGAAAGIAASAATARLLASLTGNVGTPDGITLIGVVCLLAVVGAAATLAPAYRAVRIDPASALRNE